MRKLISRIDVKYRELLERSIKFGLVGGVNTLISIILFYIAFEVLSLPLYTTYIVIYCLLTILSYVMNARFTFGASRNRSDFSKYATVYIVGMLIGIGSLYVLDQLVDWRDFFLTLLVIPVRVLLTFLIINKVIYK